MAARSAELLRLGTTLRACARKYDCAVVVANQVADRFAPVASLARGGGVGARMEVALASPGAGVGKAAATGTPSPGSSAVMGLSQSSGLRKGEMDSLLALDHQQRFFTGWGARLDEGTGLKTPSLGLVWSHQIACRVALVKEAAYGFGGEAGADGGGLESAEWSVRRWRRWMRVAFAAWVGGLEGERGLEFEVWGGGVRAVGGGRGWGRRSRWGERGLL